MAPPPHAQLLATPYGLLLNELHQGADVLHREQITESTETCDEGLGGTRPRSHAPSISFRSVELPKSS